MIQLYNESVSIMLQRSVKLVDKKTESILSNRANALKKFLFLRLYFELIHC